MRTIYFEWVTCFLKNIMETTYFTKNDQYVNNWCMCQLIEECWKCLFLPHNNVLYLKVEQFTYTPIAGHVLLSCLRSWKFVCWDISYYYVWPLGSVAVHGVFVCSDMGYVIIFVSLYREYCSILHLSLHGSRDRIKFNDWDVNRKLSRDETSILRWLTALLRTLLILTQPLQF